MPQRLPHDSDPYYSLIIPSNQLDVLNLYFPGYKLHRFKGHGSFRTTPAIEEFAHGVIETCQQMNAKIYHDPNRGLVPFSVLWANCQKHNIPNVAFDYVEYQDQLKDGTLVCMFYEKDTVLAEKMKQMVIDGKFPKQQLYEILRRVKQELGTETDLSEETMRRWRSSCLVLKKVRPDNSILHDLERLQQLKRAFMFLIQNINRDWVLVDYETRRMGASIF